MGDKELLKAPRKEGPDLEERDYQMLNEHLVVDFEDVFAEPEGFHTFPLVWNASYNCFNFCQSLCYHLNTVCCGFCAVLCASGEVASAFFCHIWFGTPALKALHYCLLLPKRLVNECVECMVRPCCDDMGAHLKGHLDS